MPNGQAQIEVQSKLTKEFPFRKGNMHRYFSTSVIFSLEANSFVRANLKEYFEFQKIDYVEDK